MKKFLSYFLIFLAISSGFFSLGRFVESRISTKKVNKIFDAQKKMYLIYKDQLADERKKHSETVSNIVLEMQEICHEEYTELQCCQYIAEDLKICGIPLCPKDK